MSLKITSIFFLLILANTTLIAQNIFIAIEKHNYQEVEIILKKNKELVNSINQEMETPIMKALEFNDLKIVKLIIEKGADLNHKTNNGTTVSHYIRGVECYHLLENKVDILALNNKGENILHFASKSNNPQFIEMLILSNKFEINASDYFGNTPLINACSASNTKSSELLIKAGAKINIANSFGFTPLIYSAINNNLELIELLVKAGAHINYSEIAENSELIGTPLLFACKTNANIKTIETLLLLKANPNVRNPELTTPLMFAASNNNNEVAKLLINYGAVLSKTDNLNKTVLDYANEELKPFIKQGIEEETKLFNVIIKNDNELLDKLIQDIKIINPANSLIIAILENNYYAFEKIFNSAKIKEVFASFNSSLLMISIAEGRKEMTNIILNHNYDCINAVNTYFETALKLASKNQDLELVEKLINKGAKIEVFEDKDWSALMPAAQEANFKLLKLLIENEQNPDINYRIRKSNSAPMDLLCFAAESGDTNIVNYLLMKKAELNPEDTTWTPLMSACQKNDEIMVDFLIRKGSNINAVVYPEGTAIKLAIQNNNLNLVKYLIENGAELNLANENYWGPAHLAVFMENLEMLKFLIENGADINAKMMALDDKLNQYYNMTPIMISAVRNEYEIMKYLLEKNAELNTVDAFGKTVLDLTQDERMKEVLRKKGAKSGSEINENE
ncbi:MAG: ankyrin repeat domain-containing protein [Bacteroidales bacterium]|nr:ankyrin repeat domain-containing protein [Bacteroidales bacterium]